MASFSRSARGFTVPGSRASPSRLIQTAYNTSRSHPSSVPGRRSFHLSAVGDAVLWTADNITFIHHAGLPWYISIPLVAVGVNFSFRLPIQYYTRRLVVTRNRLTPLVTAWSSRHAMTVKHGQGEDAERLWRLRVAGLTERSRSRIYKSWGVQRWKSFAPFLSMAPFIIVSEALRRLCGAPTGWLSHSFGLVDIQAVSSALELSRRYLDESLMDGGCLWFTNLTAMDPYYALPVICSALLARTSWGRLPKDQLKALLSNSNGSRPDASLSPPLSHPLCRPAKRNLLILGIHVCSQRPQRGHPRKMASKGDAETIKTHSEATGSITISTRDSRFQTTTRCE
ncbi:hypothetical protein TRIATDRAFT_221925 [Trichoderma atroviride IMI 206040]|uniref:Uncharacterized protein n=1 Tax=Hypocrea atroviridis (strain ATCC 20476 / IMI 206040) TaxID=452589 RepID=G9NWU6_HYPAI|nr:uncharacterized protein TRIATDRAFT_221925 [Trichoderma atroviride IMI 206040]EHK45434.1 hypothetical protein TRIATDRAFT_221925 [Trichoderma atroviride IMI 206040]